MYSRFDVTTRPDYKQVDIPVALGLTLDFPLPNNLLVGLFGAPRLQFRSSDRADPTDPTKHSALGAGASGGIIATLGSGLGAQLSADWLSLADEYPTGSNREFVVAVGLHVRLRFFGSPDPE